MSQSKNKKILVAIFAVLVVAGLTTLFWSQKSGTLPVQTESNQQYVTRATNALKDVADTANEVSGITSGAVFTFEVADVDGHFANFGLLRYSDEVRGDSVIEEHAVVFREIGEGATGNAEVDRESNQVVSMHRKAVNFGGEIPADMIEQKVRQFLERVYPDFKTLEPSLAFDPGMKGTRLNNGNYYFRWNDLAYKQTLPEGVQTELDPFIQVGITSSGFIFSYDNTIGLSRLQGL